MIRPVHPPGIGEIRAHRAAVLASLAGIRDPQARLQWLVERARGYPKLSDALRAEVNRVTGCQVRLWWVREEWEGRLWFASDSDALTLRAMTGLLAECYSGETEEGLRQDPPLFLEELGLLRSLAESRRATVLRVAGMLAGARDPG